jgi:hypothetical protein
MIGLQAMSTHSPGWQNPITSAPGQTQSGIDPLLLLPSRKDLVKTRLTTQHLLLSAGQDRSTPIEVTIDGVIWDGHHGVRAAAERGVSVTVLVVNGKASPTFPTIMDLPVR